MLLTDQLTYLTCDLPGIGGVLKQRPEDFLVEEQPLYEPVGEGEHLYLYIEKRELTTTDVVHHIAKAFRIKPRAVGYAGLKDKHAITRQHISVWIPKASDSDCAEALERLSRINRLAILWAQRHTNKLQRGHHGGNRFVLRVRDVEPTHVVRAKRVLDILEKRGVPNYIGEQRFGYRQNSHLMGRALLKGEYQQMLDLLLGSDYPTESEQILQGRAFYRRGEYEQALEVWPKSLRYDRQALDALRQGKDPRSAALQIDRLQRQFLVSAWQSAPFNHVLDRRLREQTFDKLLVGDMAWKHIGRAQFAVDQAAADADNAPGGRIETGEVSPSGPLWGREMLPASQHPAQIELDALLASEVGQDELDGPADNPSAAPKGNRRSLRIMVKDPAVEGGSDEHGPYIRASFELPRGAYATMVMREIIKPSNEPPAQDADQNTAQPQPKGNQQPSP